MTGWDEIFLYGGGEIAIFKALVAKGLIRPVGERSYVTTEQGHGLAEQATLEAEPDAQRERERKRAEHEAREAEQQAAFDRGPWAASRRAAEKADREALPGRDTSDPRSAFLDEEGP